MFIFIYLGLDYTKYIWTSQEFKSIENMAETCYREGSQMDTQIGKPMKTKDKILETALLLFNNQGINSVSCRNISDKLGISYGNLTYHFPKKDDIILSLYIRMQNELDEQFGNIKKEVYRFEFMLRSMRVLLSVYHKYRFVFLEFNKLNRRFEEVRRDSKAQFHKRKQLCTDIANFLRSKGYLREERIKGHYDMVIHGMLILFNSWLTDAEVFFKEKSAEKQIDYYLELIYSVLRSSLTMEGLQAFNEIYEGQKQKRTRQRKMLAECEYA